MISCALHAAHPWEGTNDCGAADGRPAGSLLILQLLPGSICICGIDGEMIPISSFNSTDELELLDWIRLPSDELELPPWIMLPSDELELAPPMPLLNDELELPSEMPLSRDELELLSLIPVSSDELEPSPVPASNDELESEPLLLDDDPACVAHSSVQVYFCAHPFGAHCHSP